MALAVVQRAGTLLQVWKALRLSKALSRDAIGGFALQALHCNEMGQVFTRVNTQTFQQES